MDALVTFVSIVTLGIVLIAWILND